MNVAEAAKHILVQSAKERIRELRVAEHKARNAYPRGGALQYATCKLADTHAKAAALYEELLAEAEKENATL